MAYGHSLCSFVTVRNGVSSCIDSGKHSGNFVNISTYGWIAPYQWLKNEVASKNCYDYGNYSCNKGEHSIFNIPLQKITGEEHHWNCKRNYYSHNQILNLKGTLIN